MTRIIAGFAGSRQLRVPRTGTRPTSDRVREAIFSALEARDEIMGSRVLDLYAGSGSLGLEAASRGAACVTLVERNRAAADVARANSQLIARAAARRGESVPRPVLVTAAQAALTYLEQTTETFDLVFIDPPYDVTGTEVAAVLEALVRSLSDEATIVVERGARSPEPDWPAGIQPVRRKDYGDTALWWAARQPAPPSQSR